MRVGDEIRYGARTAAPWKRPPLASDSASFARQWLHGGCRLEARLRRDDENFGGVASRQIGDGYDRW